MSLMSSQVLSSPKPPRDENPDWLLVSRDEVIEWLELTSESTEGDRLLARSNICSSFTESDDFPSPSSGRTVPSLAALLRYFARAF